VFANALPRYEFIARQIASGMHVLNIGVGRGGLESILLKKGALVSSLDPSESAIARLRKLYDIGERAQVGFSQSMPFPDCKFDAVVMSEVLEHLTEEVLSSTLVEVRRVLKPQGYFLGTVPANENLLDNRAVCPDCGKSFHRWGHLQSFSVERLRDLMSANGFLVRRCETRAFPDWRRKGLKNFSKCLIRYVLGRAGSGIASPNIYFEASRQANIV
ncbi:MAG: class I SAM-dependent methyltransferase, partial [Burkholderiales bacterium]|nr:class I SAM-dependent methyltransferase [Burkholderiales bacterium]